MKLKAVIYQSLIRIYRVLPLKKYICILLRAFPFSSEKFYRDLAFEGHFRVDLGNASMKLYEFSTVENEIFWKGIKGGWEKISIAVWMKLCAHSNVIIDIGANTGIYSLVAAALNPRATICAFEPSQSVLKIFRDNIDLNSFKNIRSYDCAISNRSGTATFYDFVYIHQYGATLNREITVGDTERKEVTVSTKTLDDFVEENKISKIDLIKIDVEMHEPEVLEGFSKYLSQHKPTMIVEVLTDEMAERVAPLVSGLGYLYFDIDEKNPPRQVGKIQKSEKFNLLLCSEEIAKLLELPYDSSKK